MSSVVSRNLIFDRKSSSVTDWIGIIKRQRSLIKRVTTVDVFYQPSHLRTTSASATSLGSGSYILPIRFPTHAFDFRKFCRTLIVLWSTGQETGEAKVQQES
jgi:hypothetical protein